MDSVCPGGTLRPDTLTVKAVEFEAMTETRSRAVPVFLTETDSVAVVATLYYAEGEDGWGPGRAALRRGCC